MPCIVNFELYRSPLFNDGWASRQTNPGTFTENDKVSLLKGRPLIAYHTHLVRRSWEIKRPLESGLPDGLNIYSDHESSRVVLPGYYERGWLVDNSGQLMPIRAGHGEKSAEVKLEEGQGRMVLLPEDYCIFGGYRRVITFSHIVEMASEQKLRT